MPKELTTINTRCAIIELVAQLFPREEHDRWMLTPHPALNRDWPSFALQKGNEAEVYQVLVGLKRDYRAPRLDSSPRSA